MKIIGKDEGLHVVLIDGEKHFLSDAELEALIKDNPDLMPKEPEPKGLMGGWKHIGMDEGKQVVRSDEGVHHLSEAQFLALKAGTALKDILFPAKVETMEKSASDADIDVAALKTRAAELGVNLTGKKKADWASIIAKAEAEMTA